MNDRQKTDGNGTDGAQERPLFRPSVDILDTSNEVLLIADVPGIDEAHLDVTLDKNVLTIHGTVEQPSFEGTTPVRAEYGIGDFERVFTLSEDVSREGIDATVKDGVLQLRLPKTARSQRRKINIVAR